MTPFERVSAQLATIRYKPGWVFRAEDLGERIAIVLEPPPLHDSRYDHSGLIARAPDEDSRACSCSPTQIRMTRYVGLSNGLGVYSTENQVRQLAWDLARCMELHELGEWFTVGGARLHDPHALPDGRQCE